jgi:xylan 1,4-beta-xylosidase
MSYWTFSDQFEEGGPPPAPFYGGFGLLNVEGLCKPSFFAYQFLNRLGKTELACDDRKSFVTRSDRGVQVLFWNFTHRTQDTPNQVFYARDLPARPAETARIIVRDLPTGDYIVSATRVGYRSNDVFTAYLDLGKPRRKDARAMLPEVELEKLRQSCDGKPCIERQVHIDAGETWKLDLQTHENDVWFVSLAPRGEAR